MRRLLLAGLLGLTCAAWAAEAETLDGTSWKVRDNGFKQKIFFWRYDHVSFREGDFLSARFKEKGFTPGSYTASKSTEDSIAWTATLNSQDKGKVVWEGRRTGNRMEGTWTWRKADGGTRTMPWSAKKK